MVDKLIEDIVEVTETLMVADEVDIEAFAHPDAKFLCMNELRRRRNGMDGEVGKEKGGRI